MKQQEFTLPQEVLAWVESLPYNEKVKARLKRQMVKEKVYYIPSRLAGAIIYLCSPEGADYWYAVEDDEPNPEQYLPEGYIDTEATNEDLNRYRLNAEEDYLTTPISVLRYISELENALGIKQEEKP